MSSFNIRVLNIDDWSTYRELRLLSLQDSPDSFGSSYEKEFSFSRDEWVSHLDLDNMAKPALPLVAELNGVAVGLAWVYFIILKIKLLIFIKCGSLRMFVVKV